MAKIRVIPKKVRLDKFEQESLEYWEMIYKYTPLDSDADHYGILKVGKKIKELNKSRMEWAKDDDLEENNLSLKEMRDIDEEIKSTLRK